MNKAVRSSESSTFVRSSIDQWTSLKQARRHSGSLLSTRRRLAKCFTSHLQLSEVQLFLVSVVFEISESHSRGSCPYCKFLSLTQVAPTDINRATFSAFLPLLALL